MGNIQSIADLQQPWTSVDNVSGTFDIIVTYLLRSLIPKFYVEKIAGTGSANFLGILMRNLEFTKQPAHVQLMGSQSEGLHITTIDAGSPSNTSVPDTDIMIIDNTKLVYQTLDEAVKHGGKLYLDISSTYPGFTRVQCVEEMCGKIKSKCYIINKGEVESATRNFIETYDSLYPFHFRAKKETDGPAIVFDSSSETDDHISQTKVNQSESQDFVMALPLAGWPDMVRKIDLKQGGCLNLVVDLLKSVNNEGFHLFHLVRKSHHSSKQPLLEWRISCSFVEVLLSHTLTTVQRQVYLAFKYLVKQATAETETVKTYYLKTTLFWTVEDTPAEMWREDNLAQCLYVLLEKLIGYLKARKLPNYFIPESNILHKMTHKETDLAVKALCQLRMDPIGCILKFQKNMRLIGHIAHRTNPFEVTHQAILESKSILESYKSCGDQLLDHWSYYIQLTDAMFDTSIEVSIILLYEERYEVIYHTMMSHLQITRYKRELASAPFCCPTFEEDVYGFLMHLCKMAVFKKVKDVYIPDAPDCCFYLLKYVHRRLENDQNYVMSKTMTHKFKLMEVILNEIRAYHFVTDLETEVALDQCAHVFQELLHEERDVTTYCEYFCFMATLLASRILNLNFLSIMEEAPKFCSVQKDFLSLLSSKGLDTFQGSWKFLSINEYVEPSFNRFLEKLGTIGFREVPHEVTINDSFHKPNCLCSNLFMVGLLLMYTGDWKGAASVLSSTGSDECCKFVQRYKYVCLSVLLFKRFQSPVELRILPMLFKYKFAKEDRSVIATQFESSSSQLFNPDVDMSTYGWKNALDARTYKNQFYEVTNHPIIFHLETSLTGNAISVPFDKILEDPNVVTMCHALGLRRDFYDRFYEKLKSKVQSGWKPKTTQEVPNFFFKVCKK